MARYFHANIVKLIPKIEEIVLSKEFIFQKVLDRLNYKNMSENPQVNIIRLKPDITEKKIYKRNK